MQDKSITSFVPETIQVFRERVIFIQEIYFIINVGGHVFY